MNSNACIKRKFQGPSGRQNCIASDEYDDGASEPSYHDVKIKLGDVKCSRYYMTNSEFKKCFAQRLLDGFNFCGFVSPYQIQSYCLPYLFLNNDIVIHADRGSGKTVAALMVVLGEIARADFKTIVYQAVIVCRTCQAAKNSFELLKRMAKDCPRITIRLAIRGDKVSGNVNESVIVATPNKIPELNNSSNNNKKQLLVIDEVEAVELDRGYCDSIIRISKRLSSGKVILLCASPSKPEVKEIIDKVTNVRPYSLEFPFHYKKSQHKQIFVQCTSLTEKLSLVEKVSLRKNQIMFICGSRDMCIEVARFLEKLNNDCVVLNSKISLRKQNEIKEQFKEGFHRILVTTRHFSLQMITSDCLHSVVNCDVIFTPDNGKLDHAMYHKHMSLLSDSQLGCLFNVISQQWVDYALDENGVKLKSIPVSDLKV